MLLRKTSQKAEDLDYYFGVAIAAKFEVLDLLDRQRHALQVDLVAEQVDEHVEVQVCVEVRFDTTRHGVHLLIDFVRGDAVLLHLLKVLLILHYLAEKLLDQTTIVLFINALILLDCILDLPLYIISFYSFSIVFALHAALLLN